MADAKTCPKCKLVNPPDAQRCDCGYDFATRAMEQSYSTSPGERPGCGQRGVGYGCLILAPLLLFSGVFTALGAINAGGDEASMMGQVCGAFLPGLLSFAVAVRLLRRNH